MFSSPRHTSEQLSNLIEFLRVNNKNWFPSSMSLGMIATMRAKHIIGICEWDGDRPDKYKDQIEYIFRYTIDFKFDNFDKVKLIKFLNDSSLLNTGQKNGKLPR